MTTAAEKLQIAKKHLGRVQAAWDTPTDWDDLSLYGFYCLEAAVEAAARHLGIKVTTKHWEKVNVATELHENHGLPDITELLTDLNVARKAAAYGGVELPDLDAEDVATAIEEYVTAIEELVA